MEKPDIQRARDHASKWTMLNGDADIKRTNVLEMDVFGKSLQVTVLLRLLAYTFFVLSLLSIPLLLMNVSGNSIEAFGEGLTYDVVRTTLGNIGNAKIPVEKLNGASCYVEMKHLTKIIMIHGQMTRLV